MITQEELKRLYNYNKETGIFTRRVSAGGRKVGEVAGSIKTERTGYKRVVISVHNKPYKAHRLAWLYVYGKIPDDIISHIDGNAVNNAISNLEAVSRSINCMNTTIRSDNKSGVTGVVWSKKYESWQVEIQHNNKKKYLGRYKDKDEAIRVRIKAEDDIGFGLVHGKAKHPFASLLGSSLKY